MVKNSLWCLQPGKLEIKIDIAPLCEQFDDKPILLVK
jgi:hypothetical protein